MSVTKLSIDQRCEVCGSLFLLPADTIDQLHSPAVDYVCLDCGKNYGWVGNPPQLLPVLVPASDEAQGSVAAQPGIGPTHAAQADGRDVQP